MWGSDSGQGRGRGPRKSSGTVLDPSPKGEIGEGTDLEGESFIFPPFFTTLQTDLSRRATTTSPALGRQPVRRDKDPLLPEDGP